MKNDLVSQNEDIQCLALACVANVGGKEFSEALISDVEKLLHSTYFFLSALGSAVIFIFSFQKQDCKNVCEEESLLMSHSVVPEVS